MRLHATTLFLYLFMIIICIYGINYRINLPQQRQLRATDIASSGSRTIRDIEKSNHGVLFRWLSDTVTLAVAQPTSAGILTFDYWIAPDRVATALRLNTTTIALPPTAALTPRHIAILVFHADGTPQTSIAMQFTPMSKAPIAWAFTKANWRPVTPIPHLAILVAIGLLWGLSALSLQRIWQRHWLSATGASLIVLTAINTQPVLAQTITLIQHNPQFWRNCIVIGLGWGLWYLIHPRVVCFLTTASPGQRVTIGFYAILTLLPSIGIFFTPEPTNIAVQEQRQRQTCPTQWSGNYWDINPNFTVLAQCVSDNIGWRSIMIRSKNELDYRLFGVSSRVYFGNNDFYFLRRWGDERFPLLQQITQDPVQRNQVRQLIQTINDTYVANNIHMILLIAPSKEIIYPENLPWYAPRYDPQMVKNLEFDLRDAGIDVIPVTDILQQHKQDVPLLYHQRDFHWNDMAAYYVAQAVVARIADLEQRATPWPIAPPQYHLMWKSAADQNFAALLLNRDVYPKSYGVDARTPVPATWNNESFTNQNFVVWRTPTQHPQSALPNLAITGDSFSTYFRNVGMEPYFDTIITASGVASTPVLLQTLQLNGIKYVVVQLRDVSLPLLINHQNEQ